MANAVAVNPFRLRKGFFVAVFLFFLSPCRGDGQSLIGHSHNDYRRCRPLQEAIEQRMLSVEADVHLIKGELYVSHLRPIIRRRRKTLRALYLDPLAKQFQEQGFSYADRPLMLMIDFKTPAVPTYDVLRDQLAPYSDMLVTWSGTRRNDGAVLVFISGNRPVAQVSNEHDRMVALDGRLGDLYRAVDPELMPVISLSRGLLQNYRGARKTPAPLSKELQQLKLAAQEEGKELRVWGVRDTKHLWRLFLDAGIRLINTDKPRDFRNFVDQHGYK